MRTMTGVVSLAEPLKVGAVSFDGDFAAFKVTAGELVSPTNVTAVLVPAGFPSELGCVATAVYWPLESAGLALLDVQPPPSGVAVAVEMTVPFAVLPE